jgi:hypothetical protein
MKRKKMSQATKLKISLTQRGKNNSMYGLRHTKVALRKIQMATKGNANPMYGKHHSAETRKKISLAMRRSRIAQKRIVKGA